MKIKLDFNSLTLRETAEFEELSGIKIASLQRQIGSDAADMGTKELAALIFVSEKRNNPDLTFEEVLDYPLSDLEFETDEEESPKDDATN